MRILVVGQQLNIMLNDMIDNANKENLIANRSIGRLQYPDCEIKCVVIRNRDDLNKLHGLRFDLIVEHSTFNAWGQMAEIRAMVLR